MYDFIEGCTTRGACVGKAFGGHGMHGLICDHELESLDGIEVISRANQAAAFLRCSAGSRPWG